MGYAQGSVVAERHVGGCSAHVEAYGILEAGILGNEAAGDRSRRDARGRKPRREFLRILGRHHPATGVKQQNVLLVAPFLHAPFQTLGVGADDRRQDRIGDRRREALMLENLRHDLARQRDHGIGQFRCQDVAHPLLVVGVHEGIGEADGGPS